LRFLVTVLTTLPKQVRQRWEMCRVSPCKLYRVKS